jgi:hypothetical protein
MVARSYAIVLALLALSAAPAFAQVAHLYESGRISTGIPGVSTFPAPPSGFDAVHATDIDLARYGLPPRPADPDALARWTDAMSSGARMSLEPIKVMPWYAGPARPRILSRQNASSNQWSGQVNELSMPAYDPAHSISQVFAEFVIPYAQSAFVKGGGNVCAGSTMAVGWIGIDGFGVPEVLQGGWLAVSACAGGTSYAPSYCLWAEWYPTTPVLCQQMRVYPGDVVDVEVWNTSATQGYVYLLDRTTNAYGGAARPEDAACTD